MKKTEDHYSGWFLCAWEHMAFCFYVDLKMGFKIEYSRWAQRGYLYPLKVILQLSRNRGRKIIGVTWASCFDAMPVSRRGCAESGGIRKR